MPPATPGRISVLMLTHNHAGTLEAAVDSVLRQTYGDVEVCLLDNGSIDATPHIAAHLSDLHPQVRFAMQPQTPVPLGLNRLLQRATGTYVAFLAPDDRFIVDKLAMQLAHMHAQTQLGALLTHVDYINSAGQVLSGYPVRFNHAPRPEQLMRHLLLHNDTVCLSSALLRRRSVALIGGFDVSLTHAYEHDFWLRLASQAELGIMPMRLTQVRLRGPEPAGGIAKARASESWRVIGTSAAKLMLRYPYLSDLLEDMYSSLSLYAYQAENYSAAEKYLRAKRDKFGLEEADVVRLIDCMVHQLCFKDANAILEQIYPGCDAYSAHTQALLRELVGRVVAFAGDKMDPFLAGLGVGTVQGKFRRAQIDDDLLPQMR